MSNRVILIAVLLAAAGACNGVMDAINFHPAKFKNSNFWNNTVSWENKYKKVNGELVQPLQPRFLGSTAVFVFVTDGWHLMKFLYQGLIRAALVVLASWAFSLSWKRLYKVGFWVAIWFVLAGVQAVGFHSTYTLIF
jgi:hypothetical protein